MNPSASEYIFNLGGIDPLSSQQSNAETSIPALDLGNYQIPFDSLIYQLNDFQLLPQLIEEIILDEFLQKAELDSGKSLDYSSAEFEELSAQIARSRLYRGMNSKQLTSITERDLLLQKFKQIRWGDRVEDYFRSQQRQLDRIVISILKVADPLVARELFFRIHAGEQSFAEIALEYSQDRYRDKGGTLGPVFLRDLAPTLLEIVVRLQPGELSSPFPMGKYHGLIRIDELEPAKLDEHMYKFLLDEIFSDWFKSEISSKVRANKSDAI